MKNQNGIVKSIENETFKLEFSAQTGAITSLLVKPLAEDIIGEKRLASLFRLRLRLPDYECNYSVENCPVDMKLAATSAEIAFEEIRTEKGAFPVSLRIWIELDGPAVRFRSRLVNKSEFPVAEFWFPRLGGITRFGERSDLDVTVPGYGGAVPSGHLLNRWPTGSVWGESIPEKAVYCLKPPYPVMPWIDVYNKKTDCGLYFGYHDPVYRIHMHHFGYHPGAGPNIPGDNWPTPELLGTDDPIGIVFSHIRFPYVRSGDPKAGELFEAGEFVIQLHEGDWHEAAPIYRSWWDRHFSAPRKNGWLRGRTSWFSGMLLQPEDRINADYQEFVQWAKDAKELGIRTVELNAWDKGGQDRDYPIYEPDERLGGEAGFKQMLRELEAEDIDLVLFANVHAVNRETEWFKKVLHKYAQMDEFGLYNSEGYMHWGQSTITARKELSVRRQVHVSASIPAFNEIIAAYFTKLASWGVKAMQWDKTGSSEQTLDFNPLATRPPDTASAEGVIRACEWIVQKCREVQPDFAIGSEACCDRYIPFLDVYYRGESEMMRYIFPETTFCAHICSPFAYHTVNRAVRAGFVICFESRGYTAGPKHPHERGMAQYIKEINRLREELKDFIFLARYLDDRGAELLWEGKVLRGSAKGKVQALSTGIAEMPGVLALDANDVPLAFAVHERYDDQRRSLVVVNNSDKPQHYKWSFTHAPVTTATLHAPFEKTRSVSAEEELVLAPQRLHVLIEER